MGIFSKLLGTGSDDSDGDDDKPCNVSGHRWGEWQDSPFSLSASGTRTGGHDLRIYQRQHRYCEKCDKYESRRKTLGYIDRDGDELFLTQ